MRSEEQKNVYLEDYKPSDYLIPKTEMWIDFAPERTRITTDLHIERRAGAAEDAPLELDGEHIELVSIAIGDEVLGAGQYELSDKGLVLLAPPESFVLSTVVDVEPEKNKSLEGLYRSSGNWCTQCEAEGFRRITYFLDRPDVMSVFTVKMVADKDLAPVLLSNGNPVDRGEMSNNRHFAEWHDPHPKPSYLFAMVAGNLDHISEKFTTKSGKKVDLNIYAEPGKAELCTYAMDALVRSMKWDEDRFGCEYDLDVFNIVAVSDFNAGAMENKGLNIFNDRFVLADPATATDEDYALIERIIAHEYFHNYTGNRVTCRDWFQLCLKEGLTVFRDQEFSSDERFRDVERIDDVKGLRQSQFIEDSGPLAHPPRPSQYEQIDNFYTTTVYEKGAEVVRMLMTLLGKETFHKGVDLYLDRHDGDAATIEQFIKCFEDVSERDLSQFQKWYTQAGRPEVTYSSTYDADEKVLTLNLTQNVPSTPGDSEKSPMVLPIKFGLVSSNGEDLSWERAEGAEVHDDLIVLDQSEANITFHGVSSAPVLSLFREFSAPVSVQTRAPLEEDLHRARLDGDPFNRWESLQSAILNIVTPSMAQDGPNLDEDNLEKVASALSQTLESQELSPSFKALCLKLPTYQDFAQRLSKNIHPERIKQVRRQAVQLVANSLRGQLVTLYSAVKLPETYKPDAKQSGLRALRNQSLALLAALEDKQIFEMVESHYQAAQNMTDRQAALAIICAYAPERAEELLEHFKANYAEPMTVYDKWLGLSASIDDNRAIDRIKMLMEDERFSLETPNRVRSLVGSFIQGNPTQFAREDGAGFDLVADTILKIDKFNPQVAGRFAVAFRIWRNYESNRQNAARKALERMKDEESISPNLSEMVNKTLAG
ncbi:membrane alanyl aminopeptidase [Maritalea myrionectae]|uniref:Aminopeptidase N n=1 Tax=Maritalea myrionectae TaxID=454601 RepID=A0A2R4MGD4_9HYPH|nr:aminopeptidase N [Maritalea myrionectae]AVX05107.1 membrane alanyl aminopeptidase [Maritalea myrionectae]